VDTLSEGDAVEELEGQHQRLRHMKSFKRAIDTASASNIE
jgi:hypothetical protein